MSQSKPTHATKSTKSKSTHAAELPSSTPQVQAAPAAHPLQPVEPVQEAQPAGTATDVTTQAANAIAALQRLASALPLDDSLTPSELDHVRTTNRVPLQALVIAAGVLKANPSRFPDFDAANASSAVEYEQAMGPVADEARALASSIDRSVMKRRSGAAEQSLALYATMKGVARMPTNEKTRSQVKELATLLTTNRKKRDTSVTGAETEQLKKVARSAKVASAKSAKANEAVAEAATAAATAATVAAANGATSPQAVVAPPAAAPAPTSPPAPAATATSVVTAPGH